MSTNVRRERLDDVLAGRLERQVAHDEPAAATRLGGECHGRQQPHERNALRVRVGARLLGVVAVAGGQRPLLAVELASRLLGAGLVREHHLGANVEVLLHRQRYLECCCCCC